ncbi:hypothetical protein COY27_03010 [Candidatus Woesearchaeota archaeon CG_4_10_14_0_2_um_filter_33_13]|nr:MAG: hypothetical protein COY27_03010 [Candidatus Woesearchaeota archaeon CG_4_10_14_0_2_um_filter_33_13]
MSKRGSLNLSIEAIVIVVIAFVVLGLGLGFVRSQFGDIQKTSTAVQEQISQQILDDLRTGNKPLSFPASKLVVGTGDESVQAIGVKNTGDAEKSLRIDFLVKGSDKFYTFESAVSTDFLSTEGDSVSAEILWDNEPQNLKPGETRIIPVTIKSPDKIGNYLFKVNLVDIADPSKPIDSRTFFIKTS